ncbi:MAG: kelch repeat-containing protein [Steroidobacteraceae bacterium]
MAHAFDVRPAGPAPAIPEGATLTLVPDGRILISGGGGPPQTWNPAKRTWEPDMAAANGVRRFYPSATLTAAGRVVVIGGLDVPFTNRTQQPALGSSDSWKPRTGRWDRGPALLTPRWGHAAVALGADDVLVTGGASAASGEQVMGALLASVELVGENAAQARAPLQHARIRHSATRLADGRVLVAGGSDDRGQPLASVEIYDPKADRWQAAASLAIARTRHAAVLLGDGRVLVTGGSDAGGAALRSTEIYDPRSDSWSRAPELFEARIAPHATALPGGDVLVSGGERWGEHPAEGLELWDAKQQRWQVAGQLPWQLRHHHAAALPDGHVLLFGQDSYSGTAALAWLRDAEETLAPEMPSGATLTPLADGRLLLVGGRRRQQISALASIYDPQSGRWSSAHPLRWARSGHRAQLLRDGRVLVLGGEIDVPPSPHPERPVDRAPEIPSYPAEIWDPQSDTWTSSATLLVPSGAWAEPALLPDGRVLLRAIDGQRYSTTVLAYRTWDPREDSLTGLTSVARPRGGSGIGVALGYPDGHLLYLASIDDPRDPLAGRGTDLWDARERQWRSLPPAAVSLEGAQLLPLEDGGALAWQRVAAGDPRVGPFQRWSPRAGWTQVPLPPELTARDSIRAHSLQDGSLLLVVDGARSWLFDAAAQRWDAIRHDARWQDVQDLLTTPDGRTLAFRSIAGRSVGARGALGVAWLDRTAHRWRPDRDGYAERVLPALLRLDATHVLVAGGASALVQQYDTASGRWSYAPSLPEPLERPQALRTADGRVMVVGVTVEENPAVACATWTAGEADWRDCGRFTLSPGEARRTLALRPFDAQRVLLVYGQQHAVLRGADGSWSASRVQVPQSDYVPDAKPEGTPFLADLAAVWDPRRNAWADATDAWMQNSGNAVAVQGRPEAAPWALVGTSVRRWDRARRTLYDTRLENLQVERDMGAAVQLAGECFATWNNTREARYNTLASGPTVRTLHVVDVTKRQWLHSPDALLLPWEASGLALGDGSLLLAGRAPPAADDAAGVQRLRADCNGAVSGPDAPRIYLPVSKVDPSAPPQSTAATTAGVARRHAPTGLAGALERARATGERFLGELRHHWQRNLVLGLLLLALLRPQLRRWDHYVEDDYGATIGRRIDAGVIVAALLFAIGALALPAPGWQLAAIVGCALLALAAAHRLWHNVAAPRLRWGLLAPLLLLALAVAFFAGMGLVQLFFAFIGSLQS